jgi:hypothetical protein
LITAVQSITAENKKRVLKRRVLAQTVDAENCAPLTQVNNMHENI